ncbi:helix-turn-helix domain-containing protein [Mycetocola reblochoni]|uniref:helix-turn-helix domain-containing protein n=1 Tax=Microbacteriaceae TaxID=85023 RepID=UPI003F9618A0
MDEHGVKTPLTSVPLVDLEQLLRSRPSVLSQLRAFSTFPPTPSTSTPLTPRERIVLHAIVDHRTVADISKHLSVSDNTVKSQLRSLYRKLVGQQRSIQRSGAASCDRLKRAVCSAASGSAIVSTRRADTANTLSGMPGRLTTSLGQDTDDSPSHPRASAENSVLEPRYIVHEKGPGDSREFPGPIWSS